MTVQAMPLPRSGAIVPYLAGADFADAWCVDVARPERTALQHFRQALNATPSWVHGLMRVRNRAVSLVGLKHNTAVGIRRRARSKSVRRWASSRSCT